MGTIDLHDLATVLLRERLLTEPRFKHSHLREMNDGSAPRTLLPHTPLPVLDDLPSGTPHVAYFLVDDETKTPKINETAQIKYTGGTEDVSDMELETFFWRIRHHDSGYTLAHAMQLVLDALPTATKLRIRTSQGHILTIPATSFSIVKFPVTSYSITYICKLKMIEQLESGGNCSLSQYTTGASGPFPWVYMLFGEEDVARTEQLQNSDVVLDLVSPMLNFRGLGGEIFSMESPTVYHKKLLPRGAFEGRPTEYSSRIASGPNGPPLNEVVALSERVLARLARIMSGEDIICAYCGKEMAKSLCTVCRKVRYCDRGCQVKAWKYHKTWCKVDARSA